MREYIFTDLACEAEFETKSDGLEEDVRHGIRCIRQVIGNVRDEKRYGRKRGEYVTWMCPPIWQLETAAWDILVGSLSTDLCKMIKRLTDGVRREQRLSVMVAGLGNAEITADAIGPETVQRVTVTRHLLGTDGVGQGGGQYCSVSAIVPGVLGNTGIETVEILRGAIEHVKPDVLIAVDALAARSCERLAATVQLSDAGIMPGSGIGNMRLAINREELGIPVIALGVPTVVNSTTMIYEVLMKGGVNQLDDGLRAILENRRSFFVTPKESDLIVRSASLLLAQAINQACLFAEA